MEVQKPPRRSVLPVLEQWSPRRHIKSIVYGGLDGIITIFSMVASTSGANLAASILLTIGFANLIADAFSMSISDYLSSKADMEYQSTKAKIKIESVEKNPEEMKKNLAGLYRKRGFSEEEIKTLVQILWKDKQTVVDMLIMEDCSTEEDDNPIRSAIWTFTAFTIFGFLPLLTHFFHEKPFWTATSITALTLWSLGVMKAKFTGTSSSISSGVEMLLIGGITSVVAYTMGWILSDYSVVQ